MPYSSGLLVMVDVEEMSSRLPNDKDAGDRNKSDNNPHHKPRDGEDIGERLRLAGKNSSTRIYRIGTIASIWKRCTTKSCVIRMKGGDILGLDLCAGGNPPGEIVVSEPENRQLTKLSKRLRNLSIQKIV